ncbi:MAG: helix-turn-helix transcriptional regulator [Reichenbachiella sp.]|uniref:helix-turn-helix domain-containing protein n=1 Tax=Reichenbachiella sp. TaxID=2184521 RepID=UPI003264BC24
MSADKSVFLKKLGSYLKGVREEKGITTTQMSRLMLMDSGNYTRIESGKTNPTAHTLKKFAAVLDMSLSELLRNFD